MTFTNRKLVSKIQKEFPGVREAALQLLFSSLMHIHSEDDIVFTARPKSKKTKTVANFRGSKFIGVSRNGESWQVYIVIDKRKKYVGCFSSKLEAAAIYDKLAINFHGRKAKTNFSYTKQEVLQII